MLLIYLSSLHWKQMLVICNTGRTRGKSAFRKSAIYTLCLTLEFPLPVLVLVPTVHGMAWTPDQEENCLHIK